MGSSLPGALPIVPSWRQPTKSTRVPFRADGKTARIAEPLTYLASQEREPNRAVPEGYTTIMSEQKTRLQKYQIRNIMYQCTGIIYHLRALCTKAGSSVCYV